MTDLDIRQGRLILQVGIALSKPAKFIILRLEQTMT